MKVIYGIGRVKPPLKNTIAAIGIFDGVHKGHQTLIRKMVRRARASNATSLVVTFYPHPVEVLHNRKLPYLVTLPQRLALIESLNVDVVLVIKFTRKFSQWLPEDFVKKCLVRLLGVQEVFVGDDFRFGANRAGNVDLFSRLGLLYGFKVQHMHPVERTANKISSSRLRELIVAGQLPEAAAMLGRPVTIEGKVIRGDGRGKTLGYPTANLEFQCDVLPSQGVYAVRVKLDDGWRNAVANIGHRPSFKSRDPRVHVEVHILDLNQEIYHRPMTVELIKKIRDEKKFSSADALVSQIQNDVAFARRYFKKITK